MNVIDAGAHVGEYTLLAASLVGSNGSVLAVEPQPELAELIRRNASANGLTNVHVRTVALSDHDGELRLERDHRSGGAWVSHDGDDVAPVECLRMDTVLTERSGRGCDFAKIDAAGDEGAVFAGASEALRDGALPRVAYKLYGPAILAQRAGQTDAFSVVRLLDDLGYAQWIVGDELYRILTPQTITERIGSDWYSVPIFASLQRTEP